MLQRATRSSYSRHPEYPSLVHKDKAVLTVGNQTVETRKPICNFYTRKPIKLVPYSGR